MKKLVTAIVENEEKEIERIKDLCMTYSQSKNVDFLFDIFSDGKTFLESNISSYDIVFMDIDMPLVNGIDASKQFRLVNQKAKLIFVTNLAQYAIEGYKVDAIDYLLKPTTYEEFALTMKKVMASFIEKDEAIYVETRKEKRKFLLNDILYINLLDHNIQIHLLNGEIFSFRGSLKDYQKNFEHEDFASVNSGAIINLNHLSSLEKEMVKMDNGDILILSRGHKKDFLARLNHFYNTHALIRGLS